MSRLSDCLFKTATVRLALACCASSAFCIQVSRFAVADDHAIATAWKAREDKVQSFFFEWDEKFTVAKDALGPSRRATDPQMSKDELVPPEDITLPAHCTVTVAGRDGRYFESRQQWSPTGHDVITQERLLICHGDEKRELDTLSAVKYPLGTIAKDSTITDVFAQAGVVPIALCYRILHPDFNVFKVKGMVERGSVGDPAAGTIKVVSFKHGYGRVDLWLDPDRDYVPIRYTVQSDAGKTVGEIEIAYRADADVGWVPTMWTNRDFNSNGSPTFSRHAEVVAARFNGMVHMGNLDLEFPRGTWVTDQTEKHSYVLLPSGQKRVIQSNEGRSDYERIVQSDDGGSKVWVLLALLAFVGSFVVLLAVVRSGKRRRQQGDADRAAADG